jgi:hypothetical protein
MCRPLVLQMFSASAAVAAEPQQRNRLAAVAAVATLRLQTSI